MKRIRVGLLIAMFSVAGLAACGGGSDGGGALSEDCDLDALGDVDDVEITFWHGLSEPNKTAIEEVAQRFEDSQDKITVNVIYQDSYEVIFQKLNEGIRTTGDIPDVIQAQEIRLQELIDLDVALPVQACIDADDFDTSDFVPRMIDYYTVDDVTWSLPANPSNPVLLYDKNAFRDAGLDPEDPPETLEEFEAAARALKENAGVPTPIAIKMDGWFLEQWSAKAGELYANNGNGRESHATAVEFDTNGAGLETFEFLNRMVEEDLAVAYTAGGANPIENLLALGEQPRRASMTIDSSAALGGIVATLFESAEYEHVDLGVGFMPGPTGDGGVLVGGASLAIANVEGINDPAKQAAAWEFIKFFVSPEQQAIWSAQTGYLPVQFAATEEQVLVDRWNEIPGMRVAWDQFQSGPDNLATAGALLGPFQAIRLAVQEEQQAMLLGQKTPQEALDAAASRANDLIAEYNRDIGIE